MLTTRPPKPLSVESNFECGKQKEDWGGLNLNLNTVWLKNYSLKTWKERELCEKFVIGGKYFNIKNSYLS
jgi:hypothetical protein